MLTVSSEESLTGIQFWTLCIMKIRQYRNRGIYSFRSRQKINSNIQILDLSPFGGELNFNLKNGYLEYTVQQINTKKKPNFEDSMIFELVRADEITYPAFIIFNLEAQIQTGYIEIKNYTDIYDIKHNLLIFLKEIGLQFQVVLIPEDRFLKFSARRGPPKVTIRYLGQ